MSESDKRYYWNHVEEKRIRNAEYRSLHGEALARKKREWRLANLDLARKQGHESYQRNRQSRLAYARSQQPISRSRIRHKRTGMNPAEFAAKLQEQNFTCAICGITIDSTAHADHNHETGQTRGVLCRDCNLGLGWFSDDFNRLTKAVAYLAKWSGGKTCEQSLSFRQGLALLG